MEATTSVKDKVTDFIKTKPAVIFGIVLVVILLMIAGYASSKGYGMEKLKGSKDKKKGGKGEASADEEVDDLIASIHKQQGMS